MAPRTSFSPNPPSELFFVIFTVYSKMADAAIASGEDRRTAPAAPSFASIVTEAAKHGLGRGGAIGGDARDSLTC